MASETSIFHHHERIDSFAYPLQQHAHSEVSTKSFSVFKKRLSSFLIPLNRNFSIMKHWEFKSKKYELFENC